MTRPWWRGAVGYEVYLRSFQDTDGDGVGDLPGLRSRLDHLADLGVDLVWVTPFYPSPMEDHGYDVADFRAVDPVFGDLDDADTLVAEAHALGMRVVFDLVPNHTSDRHPWFVDATSGRDAARRDYYVWRDPGPDGGPPNNWVSHFGGPAWTLHEPTGQYYMHLFLPEQPDLNWANERVRDEFDDILRFWFERGVDGFRIDVAHSLVEDPQFRDNPAVEGPAPALSALDSFNALEHRYDLDQPGVVDIYRRWNTVARDYDAMLLGEVYLLEPELLTRYLDGGAALHSAFCFLALKVGWDADAIGEALRRAVAAGEGALSWPLSSHDDPHAAERFGGGERGARRALAYLALLCALPGVPFLYQGDELGLDNGVLGEAAADPVAVRNRGQTGRDGSRTPMPWAPDQPSFGFTTGRPWLPVGANRRPEHTVAAQVGDPDSWLERTRTLLHVRRSVDEIRGDDPVEWLDGPDGTVTLRRGDLLACCNCTDRLVRLTPPAGDWRVVYRSVDDGCAAGGADPAGRGGPGSVAEGASLRVPADATVWAHRVDPGATPDREHGDVRS